uniref:LIM zinc-binding domain-containing protein n=1 Tax=Panagrellus redivivus TaxID=6233 RepID=A0A7E4VVJ2_PANRE
MPMRQSTSSLAARPCTSCGAPMYRDESLYAVNGRPQFLGDGFHRCRIPSFASGLKANGDGPMGQQRSRERANSMFIVSSDILRVSGYTNQFRNLLTARSRRESGGPELLPTSPSTDKMSSFFWWGHKLHELDGLKAVWHIRGVHRCPLYFCFVFIFSMNLINSPFRKATSEEAPASPTARTPLLGRNSTRARSMRRMSTTETRHRRSSMGTFLASSANGISASGSFNNSYGSTRIPQHQPAVPGNRRFSTYWRSFDKYTPFVPPSNSFGSASPMSPNNEGSTFAVVKKRCLDQFMAIRA